MDKTSQLPSATAVADVGIVSQIQRTADPERPDGGLVQPFQLLIVDDESVLSRWVRLSLKSFAVDGQPITIGTLAPARMVPAALPDDLALLIVALNSPDAQAELRLLRQLRMLKPGNALRVVLVAANSSCIPAPADLDALDVSDCWLRDELDRSRVRLRMAACLRHHRQLTVMQRREQDRRRLFEASRLLSRVREPAQQYRLVLSAIVDLLGHTPLSGLVVRLAQGSVADAELRIVASLPERTDTAIATELELRLRASAAAQTSQGDLCSRVFWVEGGEHGDRLLCYVEDREPLSTQHIQSIEQLLFPVQSAHRAGEALRGLHQRALTDSHLDIPNRTALVLHLQQLIDASATRHQLLMLIDIDRFSEINLSFGFDYGDEVLRELAAALTGEFGPSVMVARVHDDVMALLGDERELSVGRLREALRAWSIELARLRIHTARQRLTGYQGSAERALAAGALQIKMSKRGEIAADSEYTPLREQPLGRARKLLSLLRDDLQNDQVEVHYQPQLDLASGQVVAVEALARWRTRDGEVVSPAVFIPLAERSGDIVQLGNYVLRNACRDFVKLREQHPSVQRFAVNCSASQFAAPDFVGGVLATLRQHGLQTQQFEVEVTESVAMQDIDAVQQRIDALREAGVHLALDDFGTGFSSLMYLRRLKFDCIKIDRSFVAGLGSVDGEGNSAIVDLIIRLARRLGCRVISEGVENTQQMRWLQRHGCRLVQGYGVGPAMPVDALVDWLRQRS